MQLKDRLPPYLNTNFLTMRHRHKNTCKLKIIINYIHSNSNLEFKKARSIKKNKDGYLKNTKSEY